MKNPIQNKHLKSLRNLDKTVKRQNIANLLFIEQS